MNKPTVLIIEETRDLIISTLNSSNLPAWVMRDIVKEIYTECVRVAAESAEREKEAYYASLEKEEEQQ